MSDASPPGDDPRGRFRRLGRRILGEAEELTRERNFHVRDAVTAVLEGSDKAKSEIVRAVAREVRNYLDELGLKEDVRQILDNYALDARISINLRRLTDDERGPAAEKEAVSPVAAAPSADPPATPTAPAPVDGTGTGG
jgi:hypothetical protein